MKRVCLLVYLVVTVPTQAADPRPVTPEDYFSLATVTDFAVSPDGKTVAYCEGRWQAATNDRKTDLWLAGMDGKARPHRLTGERANDCHPRWSGDGKLIYVLGNRKRAGETQPPYDGTTQIWAVPPTGGEPRAITRIPGGISTFDYAPLPDVIVYSVDTKITDQDPFTALRNRFDTLDYGHGRRQVSELIRLDLHSWRTETLVPAKQYIRELAVTRDGQHVALINAPDDSVIASEGSSRVEVWDAETRTVTPTDERWRAKLPSPFPWLESLAWNSEGDRLAYCAIFDAYPAKIVVNEREANVWQHFMVKPPEGVHVKGYSSPLVWLDDRAIGYLGEARGFVDVYSHGAGSRATAGMQRPGVVVHNFAVTPTGGAVTYEATSEQFPELVLRGQTPTTLTQLNPQTKEWALPTVRHISWKSSDGKRVGGILELPPNVEKGKKLPLVVAMHGGPTTSTTADLSFDPHNGRLYFAAAGYAVLLPNYRGSTGYGDEFTTDLIGNENDIEVKDILAGIQYLIAEGIADPERIGVMGWSNGGYLTNCLITLKDSAVKFRAASSGAGILDTVAEWGFNDEPAYPWVFKKGHPWQTPEIYRKTSPTYGLGNVTTPTLIHVGANDVRCPPGHSRMLYRALKHYVKVPTELIEYPNEPHGLTRMNNRKAKMEWDLAWFEKYMKN